ncbi:anti-sigma F factor [Halanaerobacter jeridensis]|uniref:Stage II sporulation protein AB (Anti-sigma F factor) n=1 Tax=Halanaerobacter jeridensis TaxID=706427 RepID=A0A938XQ64_9FIRM|nr:anti-sigma F factor [Halanaerobacter jeridensis]MBM7555265.1 stage II sporulation protein AB (anti-sigma F factor) [Halanaerobacter jeridensis]
MGNYAKLIIKSQTDNLGLARITAASFAAQLDFTVSEIEELKVAISEAVSNAIVHGYQEENGEIEISMELSHNQLIIVVVDEGVGMANPKEAFKASYTTTDERMGLGLTFINSFMDKVEIDSKVEVGTKIKMIKSPEQIKKQIN